MGCARCVKKGLRWEGYRETNLWCHLLIAEAIPRSNALLKSYHHTCGHGVQALTVAYAHTNTHMPLPTSSIAQAAPMR